MSPFLPPLLSHTTTTYYHVHCAAASACANAFTIAMIIAIVASVPISVFPPLHGPSRTHRAGGLRMAGGSQEPHQTNKQTEKTHLPFLRKFYHYYSHTHLYTLTHDNSPQSTQFLSLTGLAQFGGGTVVGGFLFDCCLICWQNAHICLYQFHLKSGRLFWRNYLFPRSARTASIQENGGK